MSHFDFPRCDRCGKFLGAKAAEWQMVYSGHPPSPDCEIYRCSSCVEKHGSFSPQSGIVPEYSCGKFIRAEAQR